MMFRVFEIAFAAVLFVTTAPIILICAVLVRIESKGNPLFLQTRIGRGQVPFTMYKLRTMRMDTENLSSHEVSEMQITKVGRFLRRTKIDELPQALNILKGDMSLVGPRPCLPNQTELIAEREKLDVFSVRPGITGPAQLAGLDMSRPKELARVDAAYIAERTPRGDLQLILRTAKGDGSGDAVTPS